ncbi:MAG: hypothetical protein FK733_06995 [Asgard group archaeon]|nr:hypothetical protein [Asgard group archaeon]
MLNDESIIAVFSSLKKAIEQKNIGKIKEFYNQNDKQFFEKIESSYLQWFEIEGVQYNHEILKIIKNDSSFSVILSRVVEYIQDKLEQHNHNWSKLDFSKINGEWLIINEAVFNIADNIETNLQVYLDTKGNKLEGFAYLLFDLTLSNVENLYLKLNRGLVPTDIFDNNDNRIMFLRKGDSIELKTKDVTTEENKVVMKIKFNGIPYNTTGKFGYKIVYIGEKGSYASFISNWYPQIAYSKSTGKVYFNVPENFVVTCTGKEVEKYYLKDRLHYVFQVDILQIYAFAAAKYFNYNEEIDGKKYGAYILNGGEEKAKLYLQKAIEIISFLKNEVFGMYPYENYSIVEIPSKYVGRTGGMSEQGMNFYPDNSLNEYYVNTPIFAHEIGHLWWANWVIGDSVFISEGLANIGYALSMEKLYGEEIMRKFLKYGAIDYYQAAYYYFASTAEREDMDMKIGINVRGKMMNLHSLSNTKGFFVLLMLRDIVGKKAFYKGFQTAIEKYAHTYMTLDELRGEFELASGADLMWFFDQWFFRIGAPEFKFEYKTKKISEKKYETTGTIKQLRELYRTKIEIELADDEHKITNEFEVKDKETNIKIVTDFNPNTIEIDPNYKVFRWTEEFKKLSLLGDSMKAHWVDLKKSDELMKEYLEKEPNCILGHSWSGYFNHRYIKDQEQAKDDFNYVIENAEPYGPYEIYYVNALYYLGLIYQDEGDKKKAHEVFEKLLEKDRTKRYHLFAKKKIEKLKEK